MQKSSSNPCHRSGSRAKTCQLPTCPGATRTTTTQRVPSKHPVDPTLLREIGNIATQLPIMLHTTAGPSFDVEKIREPLDPVIPQMKDDMPIAGPINASRRAHHGTKQLSKCYIHLVKISLVKRAVGGQHQTKQLEKWWHQNIAIDLSNALCDHKEIVCERKMFLKQLANGELRLNSCARCSRKCTPTICVRTNLTSPANAVAVVSSGNGVAGLHWSRAPRLVHSQKQPNFVQHIFEGIQQFQALKRSGTEYKNIISEPQIQQSWQTVMHVNA